MKSVRVNTRACSAAAALLMLGGCSSQALYAGAQETQKMECRKMQGDDRDRCLQNASMSYDKYQAERQRAAKPGN
ncbi:MAG: hypothetical protein QM702_02365 [Rubrivivax sp.]